MTTGSAEETARRQLARLGVSRETIDRLEAYVALLAKWTRRVNLVSPASFDEVWTRHILDSAQLAPLAPPDARTWLDIGTGAGLPGLVCALVAADIRPHCRVILVECDRRKSAFLATCLRELDIDGTLHTTRIEDLPPRAADVISARALAPLTDLFTLAAPHATAQTVQLYPKGNTFAAEIAAARAHWRFTVDAVPSITNPSSRILHCRLQGADPCGRSQP